MLPSIQERKSGSCTYSGGIVMPTVNSGCIEWPKGRRVPQVSKLKQPYRATDVDPQKQLRNAVKFRNLLLLKRKQ